MRMMCIFLRKCVEPFLFYWFVCFEGVIWKGDKLIEGVPETLDMLRAKVGKQSLVQFI